MDKNDLEKKKIYEWACKYAEEGLKTCFTVIDEGMESFYEKRKSRHAPHRLSERAKPDRGRHARRHERRHRHFLQDLSQFRRWTFQSNL